MPNFKVFQDDATQLLARVSNPTAGCLLSTVSNTTAGCLLSTVSNTTAGCLLSTVNNTTAGCLLSTVNNSTAGCLLSTVNNSTAACLLETLGDRSTLDTSETTTANAGATAASTTRTVLNYSTYTFAAYNVTNATQTAQLQLSTDGTNFVNDGTAQTIAAVGTAFFAANFFTKYARLLVTADATTTATIVVQTQAQV